MLILGIIVGGAFVGWLANLVLGGGWQPADWGELLAAGLVGSFVGGTLLSLLFGDGFALRPSGIIGSVIGAVVVLVGWRAVRARSS
ncbi:MAG: GlsB/YeaQ/YmgE family stress response membrane protein [Actinomycetota bacterium]